MNKFIIIYQINTSIHIEIVENASEIEFIIRKNNLHISDYSIFKGKELKYFKDDNWIIL